MKNYKLIVLFSLSFMLLCSCKTQYVPIEVTKTEYQNHTDTVREKDSIYVEKNTVIREADSATIAKLGLQLKSNERAIIILQNELQRVMSEKQQHSTDTVIKTDSIPVPYLVEKKLSAWQQFKLDFGGRVLAITFIIILLLCVRQFLQRRSNGS